MSIHNFQATHFRHKIVHCKTDDYSNTNVHQILRNEYEEKYILDIDLYMSLNRKGIIIIIKQK